MSRAVFDQGLCSPFRRHGVGVLSAIVLASVALTGVSVSVASAGTSRPGQTVDGLTVGEDGNAAWPSSTGASGEYIVQLEDGASLNNVLDDVTEEGVQVTGTLKGAVDGFTAPLHADEVAELRSRDDVVRVERQQRYELTGVQDNPPWHLDRIDQRALPLDSTFTYPNTGTGVDVYIIDSGIRTTHSEFTGRLKPGFFVDYGDGNGIKDCVGHGTHVAATVGGTTFGVAKGVSIVPVNVEKCGETGAATVDLVAGMNWVVENHQAGQPAVANISMAGPRSGLMDAAVGSMIADGITVVAAAGNDPTLSSCLQSPAGSNPAITVAASTATDGRAWFSSYGQCNDIFAPGVDIRSASFDSDTGSTRSSGTSMAAPQVAGAAALVLERNPTYTPANVWTALDVVATTGVITDRAEGDPDKLLHITTEPGPPLAPVGLTAEVAPAAGVGSGQVRLSWTAPYAPTAITDYIIEYWDGNFWTTTGDGVSTATTYTVGGLKNGSSYPFRVKAKTFMEGPVSEVSATPLWTPDAPDWLIAITWPSAAPGTFEADLTWATERAATGRPSPTTSSNGPPTRRPGRGSTTACRQRQRPTRCRDWRPGRTTPSGSRPRTRSGSARGALGTRPHPPPSPPDPAGWWRPWPRRPAWAPAR